jgi:hypothetical protein
MITLPEFADKSKLIDYLVSNKSALLAQKKSAIKHADSIMNLQELFFTDKQGTEFKAGEVGVSPEATRIKVRSIINTTKLFDSHGDVHFDQLWNKSIKETKDNFLVKEHNFSFDGIISDNVKVFTKQISWHELGYNYEGSTQALVYESIIDKNESPDMFEKYRTGKVKQHSVGMRYIKIDLAVNDARYEKEFAVWEKNFEEIANKEEVLDNGYFWAVFEAKNIEGSAVVKGSNRVTPTQSIQQVKNEEPTKVTLEPVKLPLDISKLMKNYQPIKHI